MVTTIGTESRMEDLLHDLIHLDYDAIAAYQAAIDRLEDSGAKQALTGFRRDHEDHIRNLTPYLEALGGKVPADGDMKQVLTKGKVVVAGLIGDKAILMAMRLNEEDTNTAYERAVEHAELPPKLRDLMKKNLADERRHREWLVDRIKKM